LSSKNPVILISCVILDISRLGLMRLMAWIFGSEGIIQVSQPEAGGGIAADEPP
jgi:hypothetical protein